MAESQNYTALQAFDQARRDIHFSQDDSIWADRINISNRAKDTIVSVLGEIIAPGLMVPVVIASDNDGKIGSSAMSWDSTTKRLTATMEVAFVSTDVGKEVMFTEDNGDGTHGVYTGYINEYVSPSIVGIRLHTYPAADIAVVDHVTVSAGSVDNDEISIAYLPILRYGEQVKIDLQSSETEEVIPMSREDLNTFVGNGRNYNAIAFAISGMFIYLKKGDGIASYGTLKLFYPEIPENVYTDSDSVKLFDGAMMMLYIVIMRQIILRRMGKLAQEEDVIKAVQGLYQSYNQSAKNQVMVDKTKAILQG